MLCLLRHGADTSNQYLDGNTPQHEAVCWEVEGVVAVFLDRGADVNARNCEGDSPMFLFSCCSDSYSVVEKLVEFGWRKRGRTERNRAYVVPSGMAELR